MDPNTLSFKDWLELLDGPTIFAVLLVLNMRGWLLWKSQVDTLVGQITTAAEKLDAVRVEQIEEERTDKQAYKRLCEVLKVTIEAMKPAERRKVGP